MSASYPFHSRKNKEPHPILRKLPPLPPPPQPRLMPVKPAADDELLRTCFHCGGEGSGEGEDGGLTRLHSSSEIKICSYCKRVCMPHTPHALSKLSLSWAS
jgi:hypothetical protein